MKGISAVSVYKMVILLLTLNNVHSDSRQWYDELHRSYFNYDSMNEHPSTSHDNDTKTSPTSSWVWPFNQESVIKGVKNPPTRSKGNENDMSRNDRFICSDMQIVNDQGPKPMKFHIGEAPACSGSTFCEDVSNYPTKFLNDAINNRRLGNYENVDALDLNFRIGTDTTESLCLSIEEIIFPKSAESMNNKWMFIVNHDNYTQGIHVETCIKAGEACRIIAGFAEGYETTCEQKYVYRKLAAINKDGSIRQEFFRFPASCCCRVQFLGTSLRERFSRLINPQKMQSDVKPPSLGASNL